MYCHFSIGQTMVFLFDCYAHALKRMLVFSTPKGGAAMKKTTEGTLELMNDYVASAALGAAMEY